MTVPAITRAISSRRSLATNRALWQVVAVIVGARIGAYLENRGAGNLTALCAILAVLLASAWPTKTGKEDRVSPPPNPPSA